MGVEATYILFKNVEGYVILTIHEKELYRKIAFQFGIIMHLLERLGT